jgi:hypothetical protein
MQCKIPNTRPSPHPAPQALPPARRIHLIDLRIREAEPATSPPTPAPLEPEGGQRHSARIQIPAWGTGKGRM